MPIPNKAIKVKKVDQRTVDLTFEDGRLEMVEGKQEWIQANYLGLISQEGDWNFDPSIGLPWVNHPNLPSGRLPILGRKPPIDEELIEVYVYQQLSQDPRNEVVKSLNADWQDFQSRTVQVEGTIVGRDGVEAVVSDEVTTE